MREWWAGTVDSRTLVAGPVRGRAAAVAAAARMFGPMRSSVRREPGTYLMTFGGRTADTHVSVWVFTHTSFLRPGDFREPPR